MRSSATRGRGRTETAGPDDPDANDKTPEALRQFRAHAARPSGNRTAAPRTAAGVLLRSCSGAPGSRRRARRVPEALRSIRADRSPDRAVEWPFRRTRQAAADDQASALQNFSVRYFSAPSGKIVT